MGVAVKNFRDPETPLSEAKNSQRPALSGGRRSMGDLPARTGVFWVVRVQQVPYRSDKQSWVHGSRPSGDFLRETDLESSKTVPKGDWFEAKKGAIKNLANRGWRILLREFKTRGLRTRTNTPGERGYFCLAEIRVLKE